MPPIELSQHDRIVQAVLARKPRWWTDANGDAYVALTCGDHVERYALGSRAFRRLVRHLYSTAHSFTDDKGNRRVGRLAAIALDGAIEELEALARFGTKAEAALRVASESEGVWIDLGDPGWHVVEVTPEGWLLTRLSYAPLIRNDNMAALPLPTQITDDATRRDARNAFRDLFRNADDQAFIVIASWLVAALGGIKPIAPLAIDGPDGSGKTTITALIRRLVDPSRVPHRGPPKNDDELMVTARHNYVICIDNASKLTYEQADMLCRIATGMGLDKRRLFTDFDQASDFVHRPVIWNGIPTLLTRGDLASRAHTASLTVIPEDARLTQAEVDEHFAAVAPLVLGLLLDALVTALARRPFVRPAKLPRMADFTLFACAAAPAFGWSDDDVLAAIEANQRATAAVVLEADPLGQAIITFQEQRKGQSWEGSATALLAELQHYRPSDDHSRRGWPADPTRLSGMLGRLETALEKAGVARVLRGERGHHHARFIRIEPVCRS
jgi:hypothetical protein